MHLFVDFLFLAFGITLTVICIKRGLILSLIKFSKMMLSALAATLWGGAFAEFVGENILNAPIRASVYQKVSESYQNASGELGVDASMSVLPQYLQTDAMRDSLSGLDGTGESLVNSVTDTITEAISSVVCGVIGYALVFVSVFMVLSLVYILIKGARQMFPTFGTVDSVCGGLLGLVFAWTVLLFAGSVLRFFCGTQPIYTESSVVKFFGESATASGLDFLNLDRWLNGLIGNGL